MHLQDQHHPNHTEKRRQPKPKSAVRPCGGLAAGYAVVESDGPERAPTTRISQYGALLPGTVLSG